MATLDVNESVSVLWNDHYCTGRVCMKEAGGYAILLTGDNCIRYFPENLVARRPSTKEVTKALDDIDDGSNAVDVLRQALAGYAP